MNIFRSVKLVFIGFNSWNKVIKSVHTSGSHVVGSIPLQALMKSADYYIEKEHVFLIKEQQKLRFIIDRLGLNSVSEFKPESKVINVFVSFKRAIFLM